MKWRRTLSAPVEKVRGFADPAVLRQVPRWAGERDAAAFQHVGPMSDAQRLILQAEERVDGGVRTTEGCRSGGKEQAVTVTSALDLE